MLEESRPQEDESHGRKGGDDCCRSGPPCDRLQRHHGPPTKLDNSFEALAAESDDEDGPPLQNDDNEADDEENEHDDCDQETDLVPQGPCCYFDCEHKGKRCRRKLVEEFKADVKRLVEKARRLQEEVV